MKYHHLYDRHHFPSRPHVIRPWTNFFEQVQYANSGDKYNMIYRLSNKKTMEHIAKSTFKRHVILSLLCSAAILLAYAIIGIQTKGAAGFKEGLRIELVSGLLFVLFVPPILLHTSYTGYFYRRLERELSKGDKEKVKEAAKSDKKWARLMNFSLLAIFLILLLFVIIPVYQSRV